MWLANYTRALAQGTVDPRNPGELTYRQACEMLEAYYLNNDLYRNVSLALREEGVWTEALRELRNPTYSAVEFYVMTIWPGVLPAALPIVTKNERIRKPIELLWKWSNWASKKQFAVRQFALCGDMFLRVAAKGQPVERVYLQVIKSRNVTDFKTDERGNIIWLRYDAQQEDDEGKPETWTEEWTPAQRRVWRHQKGVEVALDRLGKPDTVEDMSSLGIDFVPWVHAPFQDIGDVNGLPLIWQTIGKIDELNRKCTRLAQLMFRNNRALWALRANMVDKEGRPLPAPRLNIRGNAADDEETVTLRDNDILKLPGNASLESLVPNLNYDAYAKLIADDLAEIERDLPELQFYKLISNANASGRALAYQMAPAINRVIEARGNAEAAMAKANAMALTIGQYAGLEGFRDVGSYERGEFEHSFADRDILPLSEADRAETAKVYVEMGVPLDLVLRRYAGWNEKEAAEIEIQKAESARAATPAGNPRTAEQAAPLFEGVVRTPDMAAELARTGAITRAVNRIRAGS